MSLLFLAAAVLLTAATLAAVHLLHRRRTARLWAVPDTVPLEWTLEQARPRGSEHPR